MSSEFANMNPALDLRICGVAAAGNWLGYQIYLLPVVICKLTSSYVSAVSAQDANRIKPGSGL